MASRTSILWVAGLVLAADQATKALCQAYLQLYTRVTIIDGFLDLTHVHNRGMAFGIFGDVQGSWLRWALAAVAVLAVTVIWSYARQAARPGVLLAFGAILGGALGNLVDRLQQGYVTDFILAHWGAYQWPAFNVADSAITLGGLSLFVALSRDQRHEQGETQVTNVGASGSDLEPGRAIEARSPVPPVANRE